MLKATLASAILFSVACASKGVVTDSHINQTPKVQPFSLASEAKAGVSDSALQDLLVRHWDGVMRANPVWASNWGDHRFDSELADQSSAAILARNQSQVQLLKELDGILASSLDARDQITASLLRESLLRSTERLQACENYLWSVSARGNPVSSANTLPDDHPVTDMKSAKSFLARLRKVPVSMRETITNLREGLSGGKVANATSIQLTIDLVARQLEKPREDWVLYSVVAKVEALEKAQGLEPSVSKQISQLLVGDVSLGFEQYLRLLKDELLPAGRLGDKVGLVGLPNGLACYEASIRGHINSRAYQLGAKC